MQITTDEFEEQLNDLLTRMEHWQRCEWCGCDPLQRRISAKSGLCNSCKEWKREERRAEQWMKDHPDRCGTEESMHVEYRIQYAALCRGEGQIASWKWPVSSLDLDRELESISERFSGQNVFGDTTLYFAQFSAAQRRILMFLFLELTKAWVRHRRRGFAIDNMMDKFFPRKSHS